MPIRCIADSTESLQLQAYDKIREAILYARYAPGHRLQIKELCRDLGVGRTPVRESLVRLSQEGLVRVVPQSGTYVSQISLRGVECGRYVREHLEKQVAADCCGLITSEGIRRLADILRTQKDALERHDLRGFFDSDNLLHEAMYDITGRQLIWRWLQGISVDLLRYRWLRLHTENLDWQAILDQHYEICDAIAGRNAYEASFLTSCHLHLLFVENSTVTKAFPDYFINDQ